MREATKCFLRTIGVVSILLCGVGALTYFAVFINFVAAIGILFLVFIISELLWLWGKCCADEEKEVKEV